MKQKQELNLKQKQSLRLTNQIRLFIELLPLTHLELKEKIEEALQENPALEIRNEEPDHEPSVLDLPRGEEFLEFYYDDEEEKTPPEALVPYEPEPREKIKRNFLPVFPDERERKIAEVLIDYLDPKGFLDSESLEMVVQETGESAEKIEEVRKKMMEIPPYGVGARNSFEALKVQAKVKHPEDRILQLLLEEENLGLLKKRAYEEIAQKLGCSLSELKGALEKLKTLDPFPGSHFFRGASEPIYVDINLVEENGDLKILIREEELPPLRISPFFIRILEDPSSPESLKKYARSKIKAAQWFLSAIAQRKETLRKTVEYIVEKQKEFFLKGYNPEYLKPLNLREVASAVGVHESTISRIVSSRYISTPNGTYRLKFFFPSSSGQNSRVSSARVKEILRKIIENEPKDSPYSDEDLAALLRRKGIIISRRTVAKYREELGIENAGKRKRKYRLEVL